MDLKSGIFVSIASYRDSELIPTLHDMVKMSSGNYCINVAICWQDNNDIDLFLNNGMILLEKRKHGEHDLYIFNYLNVNIKVLSIHYFMSQGACWARNNCEQFYHCEEYFMQIDSHCRFIKDWDKEMVAMLTQLKEESQHPVISSYPPGYQPGDDNSRKDFVNRLVFRNFSPQGILQLTSVDFKSVVPIRGSYLAGGFVFAEGSFVIDVPNDPQIFFEGEEIAMAVRAFTCGYDIWHPHKILLWHFYGRKDHSKVWSDHNNEAKKAGSVDKAWWDRDRDAKKRVRALLKNEEDNQGNDSSYSLGSKRSLKEFEEMAGVDFRLCSVLPEVVEKQRCAYFANHNGEDWRKRLVSSNKKTITVPREKISGDLQNISKLHIGVYSSNNDLLEKKILEKENIEESLKKTDKDEIKIELNFITLPTLKPSVVRVSPYLYDQGWGDILEITW
ncbi:glycosyltransferase [Erwinia psidii]|uniref:GlcNAc-transferase family protein n=1 Tax=Erwinia psidii TaxID=69224 RepID=UPI00226B71BC|nr:GlcNAc-transferase family protein [Erwinia psidii]MCX8958681.1 glycosyltransferase [Erwinia psidii]